MNWSKSRKIFLTACRVVQSLGLTKRRGRIIFVLLAVFFLGPNAPAKTKPGDWRVVENLEPGAQIIVKARHRYSCTVEGATEDQLFCWVHQRRSFHLISVAIPRAEIRDVRTLPNQTRDMWIGAGVGAAGGAVTAGLTAKSYPGVSAFFGGLAGALPGALVGGIVPIFQLLIQHGHIIYKQ